VTTTEGIVVTTSDEELVERLRRGDGEALEALFDRHADRVANHCFRRTASWAVAEDATSTVFLEVWRGRARVTAYDDSALPWLLGIATNVCRNLLRGQRRREAAGRRVTVESTADHAEDVAGHVDDERRMRKVLTALQGLSRRDQEVIALVDWSGLTYDEATQALGVPVGTVRSRLSRARARLSHDVQEDS